MDSADWVKTHSMLVKKWNAEYKSAQDIWVKKYKGNTVLDSELKEAARRHRDYAKKTLEKIQKLRRGSELPNPPSSEAEAPIVGSSVNTDDQLPVHDADMSDVTQEQLPMQPPPDGDDILNQEPIGRSFVQSKNISVTGSGSGTNIDVDISSEDVNPNSKIYSPPEVAQGIAMHTDPQSLLIDVIPKTACIHSNEVVQGDGALSSAHAASLDTAIEITGLSTDLNHDVVGNEYSGNHNHYTHMGTTNSAEGTNEYVKKSGQYSSSVWDELFSFDFNQIQIDMKPYNERTKDDIMRYKFVYQPRDKKEMFLHGTAAQRQANEEENVYLARREQVYTQQAINDTLFQQDNLQKAITAIIHNQSHALGSEKLDFIVFGTKLDELKHQYASLCRIIEDIQRQHNMNMKILLTLHPIHSEIGVLSLEDLRRLKDDLTSQMVSGSITNFLDLKARLQLVETQLKVLQSTKTQKGKTKKDENAHKCKWETNPDERSQMITTAYDLLDAYKAALQDSDPDKIREALLKFDATTLRCAREIQKFCPEMVVTSKELTLQILTSGEKGQRQTVKCRHHHIHRSELAAKTDDSIQFNGSAYKKDLHNPAKKDHCHCGCFENHACWDMIWFKFGSAMSTNPELAFTRHYLQNTDCFDPCLHAIMVDMIETLLGKDLNQLYAEKYFHKRFPVQVVSEDNFRHGNM